MRLFHAAVICLDLKLLSDKGRERTRLYVVIYVCLHLWTVYSFSPRPCIYCRFIDLQLPLRIHRESKHQWIIIVKSIGQTPVRLFWKSSSTGAAFLFHSVFYASCSCVFDVTSGSRSAEEVKNIHVILLVLWSRTFIYPGELNWHSRHT